MFFVYKEWLFSTDTVFINSTLNNLFNKFHLRNMIKNTFDIKKIYEYQLFMISNDFNLIYFNNCFVNSKVIFPDLYLFLVEFRVGFTKIC